MADNVTRLTIKEPELLLPHVSGDQFDIVHQGRSPLHYNRSAFGTPVERLAAVHPDVPVPGVKQRRLGNEHDVVETDYWNPEVDVHRGLNGRQLKQPRRFQNPSAAAPGTAAFLDHEVKHEDHDPEAPVSQVYLHYANTHSGFRGRSLSTHLIRSVAEAHPGARLDFGRVMSPRIWTTMGNLEAEGRNVDGRRDF